MGRPISGSGGGATRRRADLMSGLMPGLAAIVVLLAALTDPGSWWELACLAAAAVMLVVWQLWGMPLVLLTGVMVVGTAASQWTGSLEPGMFLLSLLGIVLTGWRTLTWQIAGLVLVVAVTPMVIMFLQDDGRISGPIWVLGILFPAFMGWAFHRQEVLTVQLESTRRELAEQALLEERRRIARDVHDLVGHGLAAMMLQITSARHVLRRDADATEEALKAAEEVGRRSMGELRRTVASLRGGDAEGIAASPLPGLSDVVDLVGATRAAGMDVEHRVSGDQVSVDPVIGLTMYRIAQEALANASQHAPAARTVVSTTVGRDSVLLEVTTRGAAGALSADDPGRPRYGLRGMQERADMVNADLHAGPTGHGWLVRCEVPLALHDNPAQPADTAVPGKAVSP